MIELRRQLGAALAINVANFCVGCEKNAKTSCDDERFRVKVRPAFGCSIKRSITELNSDSHSRRFAASSQEPREIETLGSCGNVSSPQTAASGSKAGCLGSGNPPENLFVGPRPAFPARASCPSALAAHRAEFISVSGQCTDRSALGSDMRHSKRISGLAAATEPPHAPMNRSAHRLRGGPGLSCNHPLLTLI